MGAALVVASAGCTTAPPNPPAPSLSAATRGRLKAACVHAMARHSAVLQTHDAPLADPRFAMAACTVAPDGGWALVIEALEPEPTTDPTPARRSFEGQVALWRIAPDGRITKGYPDPFNPDPLAPLLRASPRGDTPNLLVTSTDTTTYQLAVTPPGPDGRSLAYLSYRYAGHETLPIDRVYVLGPDLQRTPSTRHLTALRAQDLNADGRPELILASPFRAETPCSLDEVFYGPTFVAEAHPDGSFALDTPTARAWLRERCPAPPPAPSWMRVARPDNNDDLADALQTLACARVWGHPPEALQAAIDRHFQAHPHTPDSCAYAPAQLAAWVRSAPPLTLGQAPRDTPPPREQP